MYVAEGITTEDAVIYSHDKDYAKSMIFNRMALSAEDQLRQRVAWCLIQICVIGIDGTAPIFPSPPSPPTIPAVNSTHLPTHHHTHHHFPCRRSGSTADRGLVELL